jgi:hypothetical protein
MATRKPLVLGADGRPQQLQAGDTLGINSETGQVEMTATSTVIAGGPVYVDGADSFDLARANASGTSRAIGLATTGITAAATGTVQVNGVLSLTTAEWDAAFGTTGGLTPDATYYLSPSTAGRGTATCPTTVGQLVVILGIALSTTELLIRVSEPILL